MWVKFNQTAYSAERQYFLYHMESAIFPYKWHIIFWPEKGNEKPTMIGKLYENLTEKKAIDWADNIIKEHKKT